MDVIFSHKISIINIRKASICIKKSLRNNLTIKMEFILIRSYVVFLNGIGKTPYCKDVHFLQIML